MEPSEGLPWWLQGLAGGGSCAVIGSDAGLVFVQKYGPRASAMVPVEEQWTFAELLARPDHVMPGIPVLFVAAHGTDFHDRFLKTFDPRGQ